MRAVLFLAFILVSALVLSGCNRETVGGPLPVLDDQAIVYSPAILPAENMPPDTPPVAVSDNGVPAAAPLPQDARVEGEGVTMIRVLIGTSGFASRVHEQLRITSGSDFKVWGGTSDWEAADVRHFDGGAIFEIRYGDDLWGYPKLYIAPSDADARLEVIGLARAWPGGASPQYRGRMEISAVRGGFTLINELPLEEYLYAVVPSEMPSAWGVEASKVQAITARSYAYRLYFDNRFRAYGAHIDDSVLSQVYNNIPETPIAREAVRATRGMVLTYQGEIIVANYFSGSGGTTANSGEVWAREGVFPGESPPFLRARAQFEPGFYTGDLRCEINAAAFFTNRDVPGFEWDMRWFRWEVRMTRQELTTAINGALPTRAQANPALITMEGTTASAGIGTLTDLHVITRGEGGNIIEMGFTGTQGSARVQTEFNIRTVVAPRNTRVVLNDGHVLNGWSMMPSAFFTMDIERNTAGELIAVTFYGGGHGHGVGMSQHGARALLERGYSFQAVLAHFYPGTELTLR